MLLKSLNHCSILSVTPIAVSASERANFMVKGFNLCRSTTRYSRCSLIILSATPVLAHLFLTLALAP